MLIYGNMKNVGGVETPLYPPQGGGVILKKNGTFFKKWQFVYLPKTILKMLGNDT